MAGQSIGDPYGNWNYNGIGPYQTADIQQRQVIHSNDNMWSLFKHMHDQQQNTGQPQPQEETKPMATAVAVKAKAPSTITPYPRELGYIPDESYVELAKTLGVNVGVINATVKENTQKTLYNRFINWMNSRGLVLYNLEEVDVFLRKHVDGQHINGLVWCWKPLLKADIGNGGGNGHGKVWWGYHYSKAVPMAVLMLVGEIKSEFPQAQFFVSDYEVVNPDPFLAVRLDPTTSEILVIEHWDEPTFGLKNGDK